jgi:hypothetical protein
LRAGSAALCSSGRLDFAAGWGDPFGEMTLSPAHAPRRSLLSSASTGLASLLAHGCLMLPFLLLDPASHPQLRPGAIPVELVTEPPLQKEPAAPIETPVREGPPNDIFGAQAEPLARRGSRLKRGAEQKRLAPQIGLRCPSTRGR